MHLVGFIIRINILCSEYVLFSTVTHKLWVLQYSTIILQCTVQNIKFTLHPFLYPQISQVCEWLMVGWPAFTSGKGRKIFYPPTRCTNFSNLFFGIKLYMFRTVPLSVIRNISLYTQQYIQVCWLLASCQQTCMTYTIAVCTVKNSWWWTEELSETCRVLFQK